MSATSIPLDALRGHYQLHFTDRPRATRSLALLARLREAAQALRGPEAAGPQGPDEKANGGAQGAAAALCAAWDAEAQAIATAQHQAGDGGRLLVEALESATRVRWRVARAQRLHPDAFAARPRLLAALAEDVAAAKNELTEAQRHLGAQRVPAPAHATAGPADHEDGAEAAAAAAAELGHTADHLEASRASALAARHAPDVAVRRRAAVAAARATLADLNETVVGRSPVVVRPDYLGCLVHELREASASFAEPAEAPGEREAATKVEAERIQAHEANVAALDQQVTFWQRQLRQVTAKRRQHTADELAHAVGEEADAVMEAAEAAKGPQAAAALGYLCLRMDELHRQLRGVPLVFGHDAHRETLAGLADCLAWLERSRAGVV